MALATTDFKDGVAFTGAVSASTITFTLLGGRYVFAVAAQSTSATLSMLLPDGSTYITCLPAYGANPLLAATADLMSVFDLCPGTYQLTFTATSGVAGCVIKVPYRTQ